MISSFVGLNFHVPALRSYPFAYCAEHIYNSCKVIL